MADILIKGMEMPSCCEECSFNQSHEANPWTTWETCRILDKDTDDIGEGRLADCPLVALPEHGRLGDLDRLKSKFDFYKVKGCWGIFSEEEIRKIKMVIDEEPTVLEATNGSDN